MNSILSHRIFWSFIDDSINKVLFVLTWFLKWFLWRIVSKRPKMKEDFRFFIKLRSYCIYMFYIVFVLPCVWGLGWVSLFGVGVGVGVDFGLRYFIDPSKGRSKNLVLIGSSVSCIPKFGTAFLRIYKIF